MLYKISKNRTAYLNEISFLKNQWSEISFYEILCSSILAVPIYKSPSKRQQIEITYFKIGYKSSINSRSDIQIAGPIYSQKKKNRYVVNSRQKISFKRPHIGRIYPQIGRVYLRIGRPIFDRLTCV